MTKEVKRSGEKGGSGNPEAYDDLRETNTGVNVKPFYKPEDVPQFDYETSLGDPGRYPYTRGIYPTMYRGKLWTMRQYAGFATSENTNTRFKFLLDQGQTGLSLALDLPTQLGLDSDDPLAKDDVGKLGVAIDTLRDMEEMFDGIPLDKEPLPEGGHVFFYPHTMIDCIVVYPGSTLVLNGDSSKTLIKAGIPDRAGAAVMYPHPLEIPTITESTPINEKGSPVVGKNGLVAVFEDAPLYGERGNRTGGNTKSLIGSVGSIICVVFKSAVL